MGGSNHMAQNGKLSCVAFLTVNQPQHTRCAVTISTRKLFRITASVDPCSSLSVGTIKSCAVNNNINAAHVVRCLNPLHLPTARQEKLIKHCVRLNPVFFWAPQICCLRRNRIAQMVLCPIIKAKLKEVSNLAITKVCLTGASCQIERPCEQALPYQE